MAKVGIEIRIDVKKLEKTQFYVGQKGTYATLTAFVDLDNSDQYGNNGMVKQKFDQQSQGNEPILGNSRVFWKEEAKQAPQGSYQSQPNSQGFGQNQSYQQAQADHAQQQAPKVNPQDPTMDFTDDIPF